VTDVEPETTEQEIADAEEALRAEGLENPKPEDRVKAVRLARSYAQGRSWREAVRLAAISTVGYGRYKAQGLRSW
jgi:hypothetical protein